MALAGSSPTSTVARPGRRPVRAVNASTSRATCARTRAAMALPSMMRAVMAGTLAPGQRRVLGHQLALRAVAGEAHDDHAARLDADHDPLAEGRVQDVLAEPERARGGRLGLHRRPRRDGARPGVAARGAEAAAAVALDVLGRDLGQEA